VRIFFLTLLALLWTAVATRVPTLWRDRRQRALWSSGCALALCTTTAYPPIAAVLHQPLVPHALGVLAAFFLLRFVALVTRGAGRPWHLAMTLATLAALAALAVVSGGIQTGSHLLTSDLPPSVVAYWVVLESYLGAVLVIATVLFWTIARLAPAGLPRAGLRAMAAGSLLIAVYSALKATLIIVHGAGVTVNFPAIEPPAHALQGLGMLLAVSGGLVAATRRARAAAAAYRSLLALRPLWTAMRDAVPDVILFSPRRAVIELAGVDDVHLRLYRRVIEIRDGMLALRDDLPDDVPVADDPAVTEARAIAVALQNRKGGGRTGHPGTWAPVGPDMADEVAWLSRVSRAYRVNRAAPTPTPCGSAH
jgi:uncharacterized protein DUF6545